MGYTQPRGFSTLFGRLNTLGINDRVSETLGITVELVIMPQVTSFIKHTLSFLAHDGSSIVKTLK
jgi:hypothetical protein